jgi:hypothetical protein
VVEATRADDDALDRACAVASTRAGEDPTGWAIAAARFVLVEVPLPWPADIETAAGLPPGLAELLAGLEAAGHGEVYLEAVVPGSGAPEVAGRVRTILFDGAGEVAGGYRRVEALLPGDVVTPFTAAWAGGASLDPWRDAVVPEAGARDIVVCTHGSHDPCCGRFGAVAHRVLGRLPHDAGVRLWRGSHTGGHRFSPTLIDLPDGRSWGRLDAGDLGTVLRRDAPPATLRSRYRGLGTLATYYERVAEAALFMDEGWSWTGRRVRGEVLEGARFAYPEDEDELDDRAVVRIEADGQAWEAVIERGEDRLTRGECGEEPFISPGYAVTSLRRVD